VKKTAAKKTPAKKAAATKTAAKKAPVKKAPAKKAATKATTKKATTKKAAGKTAATRTAAVKQTARRAAAAQKAPRRSEATTGRGKQAAEPAALAVRSDEKPWTAKELTEVSEALNAEADRIRAEIRDAEVEIADLFRDGGDGAGHDQADVGSTTFERDHEMSLANHSREMLTQIEHALERIEDGSYGVCESCGNPIGKLRLMAFPRATLCVSCKQRQERR